MAGLVNLWTQVRRVLKRSSGGTGNQQGWGYGVLKICTNRTGSDLALNSLVRLTLDYNDARVELTDTDAEEDVLGVVVGYWTLEDPDTLIVADAPSPSSVAVMTHGTVRVKVDSTGATRGEYAFASGATNGAAYSDATLAAGAFGTFQGSGGASGTALVLLTGTQGSVGAGGGSVTWGTPALTFSTTNGAGSIDEAIRRDAQLALFDATTPAALTIGGSGATGSAGKAARRDHGHAVTGALDDLSDVTAPTPSTNDVLTWNGSAWVNGAGGGGPSFATPAIVLGSAAAAGAASTVIRSDSTIVAFDATNPAATVPGDTAVVGTAAFAARRDHVHPRLSDTFAVVVVLDGGGVALLASAKADVYFPFACTIQEWTLLADVSGSIVLDLWMDTYANYPPTVADTITASAKPTISTALKGQSSTLTGWTTAVPAGDSIRVNIDSVTSITRCVLTLKCVRT